MSHELLKAAGDIEKELNNSTLEKISGGAEQGAEPFGLSDGNDGKYCTLTWECSICPTKTCWC